MGFQAVAFFVFGFTIATRIFVSSDEVEDKIAECHEKCGGDDAAKEDERKGKLVCVDKPDGGIRSKYATLCALGCLGKKADPKQKDCFHNICVESPALFCAQGRALVIKEECKDLVGQGIAKLQHYGCED